MTDIEADSARAELERIPLNGNFLTALQDPAHPGHKAASAHRRSLYAAAYGGVSETESGKKPPSAANEDAGSQAASSEQAFFESPANAKDYCFDPAPHGLPYDAELEQKARGWFHEAGIPQWLARNVVREWNRTIERQPDPRRAESAAAATERSLRRTWGDRYEARIDAARSLVRSLKSDEVMDLLDRSGLANNEYLIRQLVALAESRSSGR